MLDTIPFNAPKPLGNELSYIAAAAQQLHIGEFAGRCEQLLANQIQTRNVMMTPSGSAALEMAAMLCDLAPGDEVIIPSFTFVSTANAFVRCGAKPVFIDIRPDTLNMDESQLERAITRRTRAVVPVHYAGVACDMDSIQSIADSHGLQVIEDAAMALNAKYRTRPLGAIGTMGCFSFHYTKSFIAGEGGAIAVNDQALSERATVIRDKGTNQRQFFAGHADRYSWTAVGANFHISELSAAFLFGQLEKLDDICQLRRQAYEFYLNELRSLEKREYLTLPVVPPECSTNHHSFHIVLTSSQQRNQLIEHLRRSGIQSVFHYSPLHSSPMGRKLGYCPDDLEVSERISACLTRLPLFTGISQEQQSRVVEAIYDFFLGTDPHLARSLPSPRASSKLSNG